MDTIKVDITRVGNIIHDFTNKKIEILTKEGYSLWEKTYVSEQNMNRAFNKLNKAFFNELQRRKNEKMDAS